MTKISWGASGDRFYEAGADRGVLYIAETAGVPWNGLISVSEAPTGGTPTPYYIDGLKYLNLATSEEFAATIQAFSSPAEFGRCDGTAQIHAGLFVTQQPKLQFGLSYRSKIGNDIDALDHGYKIHLVYNALSSPSTRNNLTVNDSPEAMVLSWAITTNPPALALYKPSAHLIIDSRTTDPAVLIEIEDLLYGTVSTDATLPTPDELVAIFGA